MSEGRVRMLFDGFVSKPCEVILTVQDLQCTRALAPRRRGKREREDEAGLGYWLWLLSAGLPRP